jgi:hypothetical protein
VPKRGSRQPVDQTTPRVPQQRNATVPRGMCLGDGAATHAWPILFLRQSPHRMPQEAGGTPRASLSHQGWEITLGQPASGGASHLVRRGRDAERPEAARIKPSSEPAVPPSGANSGQKPGAKRLAHANASQNPPSPRGVSIRGGGMPDPPSKNRESKAACTIHR